MLKLLFTYALILASVRTASAQQAYKPQTKFEQFSVQDGAVLIKGFTHVGQVEGENKTGLAVESWEITNVVTGQKVQGLVIGTTNNSVVGYPGRSYVDYEEIAPLLKGIDYLMKVDKSATKYERFQADYRTKGDVSIVKSLTNFGTEVNYSIFSGIMHPIQASFKPEAFIKIRELINRAKQSIDSSK